MEESDEDRPISPAQLSKTPSWVMLGFLLGVLFVFALPREQPAAPEHHVAVEPPPVKLERPKLTEIEAVFAEWEPYAKWENDFTEVAVWDTATHSFSNCYEVLRSGETYYFRSIPKLTRPVFSRGIPQKSPLVFTRPEDADPNTGELPGVETSSRRP